MAGRSKKHEAAIREFCEDFYERRIGMDTYNENFLKEFEKYKDDLSAFAMHVHIVAPWLYREAKSEWEASEPKRRLEALVARWGNRWERWDELRREGLDVAMETHTFESWCHMNRREIMDSVQCRCPREWYQAPLPKRLDP